MDIFMAYKMTNATFEAYLCWFMANSLVNPVW